MTVTHASLLRWHTSTSKLHGAEAENNISQAFLTLHTSCSYPAIVIFANLKVDPKGKGGVDKWPLVMLLL